MIQDFQWLESFPALEQLVIWGIHSISEALVAPVLALRRLKVLDLRDVLEEDVFELGRLCAQLSVRQPRCTMRITRWVEYY